MFNLITFLNAFMSYLIVFVIFSACIVGAVFAGIAFRKNKDKKSIETSENDSTENV